MSKTLKISFNASGAQVDADFLSNELLEEIKEMGKSGEYDVLDLTGHIEEERDGDGVCLANGICIDDLNLECFIEDEEGNKIDFDILIIDSDNDEMSFEDWVEEQALEDSKYILVHRTENMSKRNENDEPNEEQHVFIKSVEYDYGQLVGYFDVADDFELENFNMDDFVLKTIDLDGGSVMDGFFDCNGEIDIVGLTYKGEEIELGLNFQGGGGGENLLFIRGEDGKYSTIDLEDFMEDDEEE